MPLRAFGEEYYSEQAPRPGWHGSSDHFQKRMAPYIRALGLDATERVKQVVTYWRTSAHNRLRSSTQLGRGDHGGMRVVIEVTDHVPPPVLSLLEHLPDPLLWILLHRQQLLTTRQGLDAVLGYYPELTRPWGTKPMVASASGDDIARVSGFFKQLSEGAIEEVDRVVRDMLSLPVDILGAYYFHRNYIELYWFPIWVIANRLNVAVEDLALVVLLHEMAHFYTHAGPDADGGTWPTPDLAMTDLHVVEGLAQFYTWSICEHLAKNENPRPIEAFMKLKAEQPEPYRSFETWLPGHPKRAEAVRQALVLARSKKIHEYAKFKDALGRGGWDLA